MRSNQSTNKTAATEGQIRLTNCKIQTNLQCKHWKGNKFFLCGGLKVTQAVPEKHIIIFLSKILLPLICGKYFPFLVTLPDVSELGIYTLKS